MCYPGCGLIWVPGGSTFDEATWSEQRLYDPAADTWAVAGQAKYGTREAASILLRLEPPYNTARVLLAGGVFAPPGLPIPEPVATTLSEIVTVTGNTVTNEPGPPKGPLDGLLGDPTQLSHPRWNSNAIGLPTGEVIVFNGADLDELVTPGIEQPVKVPELYDPVMNTWRDLAPTPRGRTEHNTAVLLPDGRVLIAGHVPIRAFPGAESPFSANNVRDSSFEIFSPPHLFRGPRPRIDHLGVVAGGAQLTITVAGSNAAVTELVAVRPGATTHSIEADQRAVALPFEKQGNAALKAFLPNGGDGSILPPGPYFVFVIKGTPLGPIPSVSRTVYAIPTSGNSVVFATNP